MQSNAAILKEPTDEAIQTTKPVTIGEVDIEEPRRNEVTVQVKAASLCRTDIAICRGNMEESYPLIMGHEGAGVVHGVGPDVESVSIGDHVVLGRIACGQCEFCRVGRSNLCEKRTLARRRGTLRNGGVRFSVNGEPVHHCHGVSSFSEYTVVTEEVAIPITDEIPLEEASLLGCGVFTGAGAVMNTADIEPGSSVVVFGIGGVGASAIQAAALRGATEIVAVDVVEEKLGISTSFNATATVHAELEDVVARVHDITGGVDYAFDTVGREIVVEQAVDSLCPTGTAVLIGTPPAGKRSLNLDLHRLVINEQSIRGSFNGSYNLETAIPKLANLVANDRLNLSAMISDVRPLEEVTDAMIALEKGTSLRQVICPSQ